MTRRIRIYKAQGIAGQPVEDLEIVAIKELELLSFETFEGLQSAYKADGCKIAEAMLACLPGGTIDQVLIRLLQVKASQLRVPLPQFSVDKPKPAEAHDPIVNQNKTYVMACSCGWAIDAPDHLAWVVHVAKVKGFIE